MDEKETDSLDAQGNILVPLRDLIGYAAFVGWAFLISWFYYSDFLLPQPSLDGSGFFLVKMSLFLGVAVCYVAMMWNGLAYLHKLFLSRASYLVALLCLCSSGTFFIPMSTTLLCALWFITGIGQAMLFLFWGFRLRILVRRQQLLVVCGAFIFAGLVLSVAPFIYTYAVAFLTIALCAVSWIFLYLAKMKFSAVANNEDEDQKLFSNGMSTLKHAIPFKEDRHMIFSKGVFAILYSVCLGFLTCAALLPNFYPFNEIVLGLGNTIAAVLMLFFLKTKDKITSNILSNLFLPVTVICWLLFALFWEQPAILIAVCVVLVLYGCFEMLNAHTAYEYSIYDSVRCYWELYASKLGNSVGFFIGWFLAFTFLINLHINGSDLYLLCFVIVVCMIVLDSVFFRSMRFRFAELSVNDERALEIVDPSLQRNEKLMRGQWKKCCEKLADEYNLSPRQKEVFILLAKGRNVKFITEELILSTPTVKSHVYSIYQKMNIHSHQELLDAVEKYVRANR